MSESTSPREIAFAAILEVRQGRENTLSDTDWVQLLDIAWADRDAGGDRRPARARLAQKLNEAATSRGK